jgi:hypothetical protein
MLTNDVIYRPVPAGHGLVLAAAAVAMIKQQQQYQ